MFVRIVNRFKYLNIVGRFGKIDGIYFELKWYIDRWKLFCILYNYLNIVYFK